MSFLMDLSRR
uniref:Uncharacterized protein n=1 Tax=Anguilla anguilla TaxID=7936 RepID=A0A0E9UJM3_ANGAN